MNIMQENSFTISSIHPWRMLLFGSLGALIPIAAYLISLECMTEDFKSTNDMLLNLSFLAVMALSFLGAYCGFRFSGSKMELKINPTGLSISIHPRWIFSKVNMATYRWEEMVNYSLTEDAKGKILEITLKGNRRITIGVAYVLKNEDHFDAFYAAFLSHMDRVNRHLTDSSGSEMQVVHKTTGFYQSKQGKLWAWFLILLMTGVFILFIFSDKALKGWDWFRLVFFEAMAGYFVWRALFGKA